MAEDHQLTDEQRDILWRNCPHEVATVAWITPAYSGERDGRPRYHNPRSAMWRCSRCCLLFGWDAPIPPGDYPSYEGWCKDVRAAVLAALEISGA